MTAGPAEASAVTLGVLFKTFGVGGHRPPDGRERRRRLLEDLTVVVHDAPTPDVGGGLCERQNVHVFLLGVVTLARVMGLTGPASPPFSGPCNHRTIEYEERLSACVEAKPSRQSEVSSSAVPIRYKSRTAGSSGAHDDDRVRLN